MGGAMPTDENQRSAWLADHVDTMEGKFSSQTTCHWRRRYERFSDELIQKAYRGGLDSASLSSILKIILAETNGQPLAYLPVAAYQTTLNGEPVWIVAVHWEQCFGPEDPIPVRQLCHVRSFAFTQRDLKQVGFITCG
jgi:hypothetical protein